MSFQTHPYIYPLRLFGGRPSGTSALFRMHFRFNLADVRNQDSDKADVLLLTCNTFKKRVPSNHTVKAKLSTARFQIAKKKSMTNSSLKISFATVLVSWYSRWVAIWTQSCTEARMREKMGEVSLWRERKTSVGVLWQVFEGWEHMMRGNCHIPQHASSSMIPPLPHPWQPTYPPFLPALFRWNGASALQCNPGPESCLITANWLNVKPENARPLPFSQQWVRLTRTHLPVCGPSFAFQKLRGLDRQAQTCLA